MNKRFICGMAAAVLALSGGGAAVGNVADFGFDIAASAADVQRENANFKYTITDQGVIIDDYIGQSMLVNIPSKIDGRPVIDIATECFDSKVVTKIVIPNTVKTLRSMAICYCEDLETVILPDTLETIESKAIWNCPNLLRISVPKSVKTIGNNALGYNKYYVKYRDFTIECYRNGVAQKYATNNGFAYETISVAPVNPTVTSTAGDSCANLKWNAVTGAEEYAVCGYVDGKWTKIAETGDTSYILKGLKAGAKYKVAVLAMFNGEWYSDFSKAITVSPKSATVVTVTYPKLTNMNMNCETHQVKLDWTGVSGAEQYGIAMYISGKWKVQGYSKTTTFTTPKLQPGEVYTLAICAKVNGEWDTSKINERTFKIYMI